MNRLISSARTMFGPLPWKSLQRPARISLLTLDQTAKTEILQCLAANDSSHPTISTEIPSVGFNLAVLNCNPMTVTALDLGISRPRKWTGDVDWVRANTDGVLLVVDCRDRDRWEDVLWELANLVLQQQELPRCPLLVLGDHSNAEVKHFKSSLSVPRGARRATRRD